MVGVGALLSLTKHHGLGNDFLVLLDPEGRHPLRAEGVRALCDRHLGVGADGLVRGLSASANGGPGELTPNVAPGDGADLVMDLRNADGGPAEMSGNGVACLAQAAVGAGLAGPELVVASGAGLKAVSVGPGRDRWESLVSVKMGVPEVGERRAWAPRDGLAVSFRGCQVGVGNLHLVLWCEGPAALASLDLAELGPRYQALFPGGANVEWVALGAERLVMRVFERGVGETLACGTGSVAAAAAFSRLSEAGDPLAGRIRVANPGGELVVDLSGGEAVLTTPVQRVASVDVDEDWLSR